MLSSHVLATIVFSWGVALLLVPVARWWALSRGRLDVPNQRSAHAQPTPSLGGVGIVVPVMAIQSWGLVYLVGDADRFALALAGGCVAVAAVSLWDDLRGLATFPRLLVHLAACAGVVVALAPENQGLVSASGLYVALGAIGLAWFVNLTNFMDGIDGIAGAFGVVYVVGIQLVAGGVAGYPGLILWAIVAATAGFLTYNWPPASIFMGDTGAAFLGYVLASVSLAVVLDGQVHWAVPMCLSAAFWADASWTLARRAASGQPVAAAHSSHAYQILARSFGHRRVTALYALYTLGWCLPIAWAVPDDASLVVGALALAGAGLPVLLVCRVTGAGGRAA